MFRKKGKILKEINNKNQIRKKKCLIFLAVLIIFIMLVVLGGDSQLNFSITI